MLHEYEAILTTKDVVGAEMIKYQAINMPREKLYKSRKFKSFSHLCLSYIFDSNSFYLLCLHVL